MADNDLATGFLMGQDSNNGNNGSGMWGGDGSWIFAFLIIALIFGGNGWGFGGNGGAGMQGALTRADLCQDMNFNNLDSAVRGVQQGLCDGFYAMNTGILEGFNGVGNAICNLGYQTQQGFNNTNIALLQGFNGVTAGMNGLSTQLASCCCDTQRQIERGFCDVNYNMATNTTALMQNQHNDTDRVIAKLDQLEANRQAEKMAAMRDEIQALKLMASQQAQNAYLTAAMDANKAELIRRTGNECPIPAYVVPNPNCCYGNPVGVSYGLNPCGGSGCGSCCA